MKRTLASIALITALNVNASLGPIPIYLNTEYRTNSPVISAISSTLSFSADDIKASGANTFLDFLATVPSTGLVNAQGNIPALFMRGNESDHTLVLIDGVSINDISSVSGAVGYGLKNIPLNDIEKIEIIKGSGSVVYGASAIAGVISITTKKGESDENATINAKFGTHNSKAYALSASGGNKNGFIRFTHNEYTTDGINAHISDTTDEKDSISHYATQIKFGNTHFNTSYLEGENKTEYDKCGFPVSNKCLADRKLKKIAINVNKQFNDSWKAQLSHAQSKTKVNTYENDVVSIYASDDYKSTNTTLLNDIKVGNALLNVGLSKIDDENITDKQKFSNKNLFVTWQKNISNIDVNAGIRHINHSEFDTHTVYNTGIGKNLSNGIKITANYNTAFDAPSLFEASDPQNPTKLKPETSKNINIGLNKQHSWGKINIELYKNTVNNMVTYKTTGAPSYVDHYTNEDKLTNQGIELLLNANIANYNVSFSHNYNKSRKNNSATQSLRRAKNTSNLVISKQYGKFNSRVQIIKKSSSLDVGNVELNGYTLVNLSSRYGINKQTKVLLNINNAFDKDYVITKGYNQIGRTVELGVEYKF
jgi:vitamin B12 transporter